MNTAMSMSMFGLHGCTSRAVQHCYTARSTHIPMFPTSQVPCLTAAVGYRTPSKSSHRGERPVVSTTLVQDANGQGNTNNKTGLLVGGN